MAEMKTRETGVSASKFIESVDDEQRRKDARALRDGFEEAAAQGGGSLGEAQGELTLERPVLARRAGERPPHPGERAVAT